MSPVPSDTVNPPPTAPSDASVVPGQVETLPNEALDLAAKLFDLARQGSDELITYLKAGVPPNLTNARGDTLLMLASYHGHAQLVRAMLTIPAAELRVDRGSPDPNQLNGRGQSIVAGAVFKGYDDVVAALIEHGADPLAGQPSAEDTAKMFNRWHDGDKPGLSKLFENAPGRGRGAREAAEPVPDRAQNQQQPSTTT